MREKFSIKKYDWGQEIWSPKIHFKDKCEKPSYWYVIAAGDWKTEAWKGEENLVSSALLTHTSCVEAL